MQHEVLIGELSARAQQLLLELVRAALQALQFARRLDQAGHRHQQRQLPDDRRHRRRRRLRGLQRALAGQSGQASQQSLVALGERQVALAGVLQQQRQAR